MSCGSSFHIQLHSLQTFLWLLFLINPLRNYSLTEIRWFIVKLCYFHDQKQGTNHKLKTSTGLLWLWGRKSLKSWKHKYEHRAATGLKLKLTFCRTASLPAEVVLQCHSSLTLPVLVYMQPSSDCCSVIFCISVPGFKPGSNIMNKNVPASCHQPNICSLGSLVIAYWPKERVWVHMVVCLCVVLRWTDNPSRVYSASRPTAAGIGSSPPTTLYWIKRV